MARKNKRIVPSADGNFERFMKTFNSKSYERSSIKAPVHNIIEKPQRKEMTKEEVIATRVTYAENSFKENGIHYKSLNNCFFHCNRLSDNALFEYNAYTGIITGFKDIRGIQAFINLLKN